MKRLLPPDVNRILYVRNLPYKTDNVALYDLFGKYGAIRQIRLGTSKATRGTAYVVYEDIYDAKLACDSLSGFNYQGRYLIVLYHTPTRIYSRSAGAGGSSNTGTSGSSSNTGGTSEPAAVQ
jgi:pre-mRNA branch site protein p14